MRFDGICVDLKTMHSDDAKAKAPEAIKTSGAIKKHQNDGGGGGIEPPTQGFSIHVFHCLPLLIDVATIHINQRLTGFLTYLTAFLC